MGRLLRLPLTLFDLSNTSRIQNLDRSQQVCCDFATGHHQHSCRVVHEHHTVTVSCTERRIAPVTDALRQFPPFAIGGWVWIYNSAPTIRHGAKKGTYAAVLKTNSLSTGSILSFRLRWVRRARRPTTPSTVIFFTTNSSTSTSLPTCRDGRDSNRRVYVARCKSYRTKP